MLFYYYTHKEKVCREICLPLTKNTSFVSWSTFGGYHREF